MTVLCLVERDAAGGAADPSLRALSVARNLAESAGEDLAAAMFGPADQVPAELLAAAGVARAFGVQAPQLTGYAPAGWARALEQLARACPASAVVAAGTDRGAEVLAHLGAITGLPVASGCVSAVAAGSPGTLDLVRQRWAGSLLEEAELTASPALLTVAADVIAAGAAAAAAGPPPAASEFTAEQFTAELAGADVAVRAVESAERSGGMSLATARVVVGGGRGVGSPEGFDVLEELASLLGGTLGVSRVVTSQGWRPHRQQVGQTGTRISPELYLACGISGAIQHMAGCQSAKHIVAVNTDPDAPIIARADYAVIGDLGQVIPALVAAIRARNAVPASGG